MHRAAAEGDWILCKCPIKMGAVQYLMDNEGWFSFTSRRLPVYEDLPGFSCDEDEDDPRSDWQPMERRLLVKENRTVTVPFVEGNERYPRVSNSGRPRKMPRLERPPVHDLIPALILIGAQLANPRH